jgi:hypothetical protein
MDNLQSRNYELSNHILAIVNNTLKAVEKMSEDIYDSKDAERILSTVKTATNIIGLVPTPPELKIEHNMVIGGFEFVEIKEREMKELIEIEVT